MENIEKKLQFGLRKITERFKINIMLNRFEINA